MRPNLRRLPLLLCAAGLLLAAAYFIQPVRVLTGGGETRLRGWYLTAADALRGAGLALHPADRLSPAPAAWIPADGRVWLERAHAVSLWNAGAAVSFETVERIPANWLARAGLPLFPGDRVLLNGRAVDPLAAVTGAGPFAVQFIPALALRVESAGLTQVLYSGAPTLGQALWEHGLYPAGADQLSLPLETHLSDGLTVELARARPLTIHSGGQTLALHSAAPTVGAALSAAGLTPQGLDSVEPSEDQPLPADGLIRLVRGREVVALAEELLPYQTSYTTTDELELDQSQVIQAGQYGVVISRERLRYADGVEVARVQEGRWTAAEPQDQIMGRGTRAAVKTLDTGGGTIEYYRAVTAYATSYSPCQQGLGRCSTATSSGIPLAKGVVAVTGAWYRLFAGAQVYIPGYGVAVIGDVGGGVPGSYWIDLGYSDEDYEAWHQNVTVYFLTPIPAAVPAILP